MLHDEEELIVYVWEGSVLLFYILDIHYSASSFLTFLLLLLVLYYLYRLEEPHSFGAILSGGLLLE